MTQIDNNLPTSSGPTPRAGSAAPLTPETDEAWESFYRKATGLSWVRRKMATLEQERNTLAARVQELVIVADMAAGLSTAQDCDPAHHGLVCAAMTALNYPENDKIQP